MYTKYQKLYYMNTFFIINFFFGYKKSLQLWKSISNKSYQNYVSLNALARNVIPYRVTWTEFICFQTFRITRRNYIIYDSSSVTLKALFPRTWKISSMKILSPHIHIKILVNFSSWDPLNNFHFLIRFCCQFFNCLMYMNIVYFGSVIT